MSEAFIGEIKMFAGNFAPRGWAFLDGQLLSISQNDALFSLLGTIYGGDGRTTFALPDLRGRVPVHQGTGPGLSQRRLGAKSGQENVTLTQNELPAHDHPLNGSNASADSTSPQDRYFAKPDKQMYRASGTIGPTLDASAIGNTGGSQSHNNLQPFLAINFIIALYGIYPSRQ